jgi:hypothetical protein
MARSPEQPPINGGNQKFTPQEKTEITRKWYDDTSHAGRTGAEFKAIREEVRKATILDFVRLHDDRDYETLTYENPYVQRFTNDLTVLDLQMIHGHREEIGLSDEQFKKLLAIFEPDVQREFRKKVANLQALKGIYKEAQKHFPPAEWKELSDENLAAMKEETELQEQNIPHEPTKLSPFPKKKRK